MLLYLLSLLGLVPTFQKSKCKKLLSITTKRIGLLNSRRDAQLRQLRWDAAQLMKNRKMQKTDVLISHIWKELCLRWAYIEISHYCEFVQVNLTNIAEERECPSVLEEPLASLCFAASCFADLPELQELREIFALKYGKHFVTSAQELGHVNPKFLEWLGAKDPPDWKKQELMKEIAIQYNLEKCDEQGMQQEVRDHVNMEAGGDTQHTVPFSDMKTDVVQPASEECREVDVLHELDHTVTATEQGFGPVELAQELANRKRTSEGRQIHGSAFKRAYRRRQADNEGRHDDGVEHVQLADADMQKQIEVFVEQPAFSQPPQRPPPPPPPPPPRRTPPLAPPRRTMSMPSPWNNQVLASNLPHHCSSTMEDNHLHYDTIHVHPKLPKYEDLVTNFTAMKQAMLSPSSHYVHVCANQFLEGFVLKTNKYTGNLEC